MTKMYPNKSKEYYQPRVLDVVPDGPPPAQRPLNAPDLIRIETEAAGRAQFEAQYGHENFVNPDGSPKARSICPFVSGIAQEPGEKPCECSRCEQARTPPLTIERASEPNPKKE